MSEHPEYNRDTNPYPSFGKKYADEKAIISLTSWNRRINSVSKSIYSIIKRCPGYHIVLVLSEEEFPSMTDELPNDLMLLVNNEIIELMFVYKNYKSFKKVLFTMDKYRTVPIISADDGQIYTENFAEKLYNVWLKNPKCICSKTHLKYKSIHFGVGCRGLIYPPYCFKDNGIKLLNKWIVHSNNDDFFIGIISKIFKIKYKFIDALNCKNNNFIVIKNAENFGITLNNKCQNSILLKLFKNYVK